MQVKLILNTGELLSAGKLQASGADLRMTDAVCQELPFFMDSLPPSEANAIWLRIPAISAQDSLELHMYYGNATATASPVANGDSTFIFFDDFSADTVNLDKWEPIGGYAIRRSGLL